MLLVQALAWAYSVYGALPQASRLFSGIQPVVVAIIAQAVWNMRRTVLKSAEAWILALVGRLRASPLTAPLLDGVNIVSLALICGVLAQLSEGALVDCMRWALSSYAVLLQFKINSVWLMVAGAATGLAAGNG